MSDEPRPRAAEPAAADDPRVLALRRLIGVVDRLRDPDGCPWDREQTEDSMAPHLVEEAHELVDAIETGAARDAAEEAGDVLMNVVMLCRIAAEAGRYDLARVAEGIAEKLVRRHPHVFGEQRAQDAGEALASWEGVKKQERAAKAADPSALAGVPAGLAALHRARRVCEKAVSAGFRWQDVGGALAKLVEELAELRAALPERALREAWRPSLEGQERERTAAELGDLLLAGAFLAAYLDLDPERLCRESSRRFEARFRHMEAELGGELGGRALPDLLAAWSRAKAATDRPGPE